MSIQVALNHVRMAAALLRVGLWAAQDLRDKEGDRVWVVSGHLREQRSEDGVLTNALVEPRHEPVENWHTTHPLEQGWGLGFSHVRVLWGELPYPLPRR
jgi:hypothetical protein